MIEEIISLNLQFSSLEVFKQKYLNFMSRQIHEPIPIPFLQILSGQPPDPMAADDPFGNNNNKDPFADFPDDDVDMMAMPTIPPPPPQAAPDKPVSSRARSDDI